MSSKWGGLSKSLLVSIFPVNAQGRQEPGAEVQAPTTEGSIELTANWQSPFEQSGAESKIPAIMAMLQTGVLQSYAQPMLGKADDKGLVARLAQEVVDFSKDGAGRSGMTKLNSTQVFTGAAPIKIPLTLHFRAYDDPATEVQAPLDQLARWTLARKLAADGSIVTAIKSFNQGQGFLKSLLPSEAPQLIGLRIEGHTFAPLVIESMSRPITGPKAANGAPLNVAVQLQLSSLTALDADDWSRARRGEPTQLFNNR
ncbi:MAG: hypothetical protein Q7U99_08720 [Rubrivivax sp.]|nr:hypothetical protein [Rubrivivax sp.]